MTEQTSKDSKTILVVEDEEIIRTLLREVLEEHGYRVITAEDGAQGVQLTFSDEPNVVLTDMMMPTMDGLSFIRRVRSQVPVSSLPIIVISALTGEGRIVEAFDAGATDYLVKPFRPFELLARIRVALNQRLEPGLVEVAGKKRTDRSNMQPVKAGGILDMGKYAILSEIGEGGMGKVFHSRHVGFGTDAAVKVLDPDLAQNKPNVLRFMREVRVAAQLDHPNIVKVFDIGLTDRVYYYAMEMLPGPTLSETIEERMPEETVLQIGAQLASALAYMHDKGFIHRDVKPGNVLFNADGDVKLIDFGLAMALDDGRLTREGAFVGTPGFVAPENIAEYSAPRPAADIYALGSTLYSAAVGEAPFEHLQEPVERLEAQLSEIPRPPHLCNADISQACSLLISRMMSTYPDERYADMSEVQDLIEGVLEAGAGK